MEEQAAQNPTPINIKLSRQFFGGLLLGLLIGFSSLIAYTRYPQANLPESLRLSAETLDNKSQNKEETKVRTIALPKKDLTICKNFEEFTSAVKTALPANQKSDIQDDPYSKAHVLWKEKADSPSFSYEGEMGRFIYLYDQSKETVRSIFENKIIPELSKEGFVENISLRIKDNYSEGFSYGFIKGNQIYSVEVFENSINEISDGEGNSIFRTELPANTFTSWIICGSVNDEAKQVLDKIVAKSQRGAKDILGYISTTDRVAYITVTTYESTSGHYELWIIDNTRVEKILESQDTPLCSVLETRKVGKGMECIDDSSDETRTATY